jgi:hypothetical protein
VLAQLVTADAALGCQPVDRRVDQRSDLVWLGRDVQLGTVAGRQQRRFGQHTQQTLAKAAQRG